MRPLLVLFGTLGLYLAFLLPRLLWIDETGVWVGQEHLWSDWPLHLSMARHFADSPLDALRNHPMIAGEPLRYPFAMALLSGSLMRLGLPLSTAFLLPIFVLWFLLLWGMQRFWEAVLGKPWLALLPTVLFFLSAGPGGLRWLADIRLHGIDAFLAPPQEYGRADSYGYGWYAGNFLVGMLLPQRSFLPGMTATLWILVGLMRQPSPRKLVWLGLAAGCLPLVHVHSLLALLIFGFCVRPWRWRELVYLLPGLVVAVLFGALFLRPTTPYPGFVKLQIGYQAQGLLDWPRMWWLFWGLALPTALAALWFLPKGLIRRVVLGAWGLFLLGNLILFQPVAWDNSKVFLWAYFGLSGALTLLLAHFWRRGVLGKAVAGVVFVALTLTGTAELIRLQRTDRFKLQSISAEDFRLAEALHAQTPPDARFLTSLDISNPVLWAGRSIFLGFGGWMANFGFDHRTREADLIKIYHGEPGAEALLKHYKIRYILLGPGERHNFAPNEVWLRAHFPVVYQQGATLVFEVPSGA